MRKYRNLLFYILTIGGFSLLMYFIFLQGRSREITKIRTLIPQITPSSWEHFSDTFLHNLTNPLAILLLQIITIIIAARIFSFLFRKIRQPSVIGEIIAGIILGPSLIGLLFPGFSSFLFPAQSLQNLQFLSQIGLILFMFIIGMELDLKVLRNRANEAVLISHASIIFPFALGMGLAYYIYHDFAPENVKFISFSLFIGITMSITAFPVLARILQEQGLSKTRLGAIVITCAAADDITAWCLLAAVIAIVKAGSFLSSVYIIAMAVGYVIVMLLVVRPFLKRMGDLYSNKEGMSKPIVAIFFAMLLLSSYTTEAIGIHALFGAFMAGVIMPRNIDFKKIFIEKIEDVSLILLLPLFFVLTGLRTEIGLLNDPYLWGICGLIIIVAVTGKFIGSAFAAKFVGQSWRESLIIGALMNTRGLMQLVVLSIGYDLGVLTPEMYAMMVIMALVTTFMTGPALDLIDRFLPEKVVSAMPDINGTGGKFKILVSFGNPQSGRKMLRILNNIGVTSSNAVITALHLTPSSDLHQFNADEYEEESFSPIRAEAKKMNLSLKTIFKATQNIDKEIIEIANTGNFDLMIFGISRSVFSGSLLGKAIGFTGKLLNPVRLYYIIRGKEKILQNTVFDLRTRRIIRTLKVPAGIFIDRNTTEVNRLVIPVSSNNDGFILDYMGRIIRDVKIKVRIFDPNGILIDPGMTDIFNSLKMDGKENMLEYDVNEVTESTIDYQDLMLISLNSWKKLSGKRIRGLQDISVLVIRL